MNSVIMNIAQGAPGLIAAVVFHEWAHGYAAKKFGDPTAEQAGRLSLNPSVHIDPVGTILFPSLGLALGGFIFGWAKPVPVNIGNFAMKERKKAIFWVSFAGPLMNLFLGFLSAMILVLSLKVFTGDFALKTELQKMLHFSVQINFVLMVFNLIPLPPLDGSKMLSVILRGEAARQYEQLAQYSNLIFWGAILLHISGLVPIFAIILKPAYFLTHFSLGIFNFIF